MTLLAGQEIAKLTKLRRSGQKAAPDVAHYLKPEWTSNRGSSRLLEEEARRDELVCDASNLQAVLRVLFELLLRRGSHTVHFVHSIQFRRVPTEVDVDSLIAALCHSVAGSVNVSHKRVPSAIRVQQVLNAVYQDIP